MYRGPIIHVYHRLRKGIKEIRKELSQGQMYKQLQTTIRTGRIERPIPIPSPKITAVKKTVIIMKATQSRARGWPSKESE